MKNLIISILILGLFAANILFAQIPQAFKYQAVIRDTTGQVFQNKLISLRISILKGDVEGEAVYSEIHDVWTDQFGLVNLNIGQGLDVTSEFSTIPWGEDTFFLQIEMNMDGAMNYHLLGTSQLMAVPYALYAESSGDNFWENPEEGIITYPHAIGVGNLSYMDHRYGISTVSLRVGSGNWTALDFDGEANDNQPEWRMNAHNNGYFQLRHWNGTNWDDHYLKIKPNDGFYFGVTGPKLKYSFRGYIDVTDSLKVGGNNFFVANDGKVGIGTNNPESTLDVKGRNIELADFVFLGRMYSGTDLLLGHNIKAIDYENTRGAYVANDWPLGYSGIRMYNGTIQFHAKGGTVHKGELASNELMRIVSNGNVGIGTTDPQRKLHINDVMRLEPRYSPPENPSEGDIYMDGNDHILKVYDGTEWKLCW